MSDGPFVIKPASMDPRETSFENKTFSVGVGRERRAALYRVSGPATEHGAELVDRQAAALVDWMNGPKSQGMSPVEIIWNDCYVEGIRIHLTAQGRREGFLPAALLR